jgi:phosphodiesterase/alkaline phosphatase D-like protein
VSAKLVDGSVVLPGRIPLVIGSLALGLLAPGAHAAGPPFGLGVAAGDVTSSSAILWTRLDTPGPVLLKLSRDRQLVSCARSGPSPAGGPGVIRRALTATVASDNAVRATVSGLRAGTRYHYRFCRDATSSRLGQFRTAPPPGDEGRVSFAVTGDADGTIDPATGAPAYNRFEVYARMAAERNDFNVNLGDVMYSDTAVAGVPPALTLAEKWAKYRLNLSYPNLRALLAGSGVYGHWDDHEFIDDFSVPEFGTALYAAGRKAFLDYTPARYRTATGLYRRVRWGRNLEIFLLDERSFRSAKLSSEPSCRNPQTGQPDPFPQLPVRLRSVRLLSLLGVSQLDPAAARACRARLADPSRTMLGRAQLERFKRDIERSRARFKVVLSELPFQQIYFFPYDRWEGYEAERTSLLRFLRARVENVVFLTTDLHANLVNDVRISTFSQRGGDTGFEEVVVGPVALKTFAVDTVLKTGQAAAPAAVRALFKARRPAGLGMRCAALDAYAYARVDVTSSQLTIALRDLNGNPVRERPGGRPCRQVTIPAR